MKTWMLLVVMMSSFFAPKSMAIETSWTELGRGSTYCEAEHARSSSTVRDSSSDRRSARTRVAH